MSKASLGYCAGFIDGEGCISINHQGGIELRVINTGLKSLKFLKAALGGTLRPRKQIVNKPQFCWSIYGENAVDVLRLLVPYLIDKKPQALRIIRHFDNRPEPLRIAGRKGVFRNPKLQQAIDDLRRMKRE